MATATTPRTPTAIDTAFDAWRAPGRRCCQPSDFEVRCMLSYLAGLLSSMEREGMIDGKAATEVARAFEKHTAGAPKQTL